MSSSIHIKAEEKMLVLFELVVSISKNIFFPLFYYYLFIYLLLLSIIRKIVFEFNISEGSNSCIFP